MGNVYFFCFGFYNNQEKKCPKRAERVSLITALPNQKGDLGGDSDPQKGEDS
jgi:hypothetical protein